jgi:hypothetical protein
VSTDKELMIAGITALLTGSDTAAIEEEALARICERYGLQKRDDFSRRAALETALSAANVARRELEVAIENLAELQ